MNIVTTQVSNRFYLLLSYEEWLGIVTEYLFPDTAEFCGISVNRSKIVDLQGCHPRVGGDPPLIQSWIPTFVGMTIVN